MQTIEDVFPDGGVESSVEHPDHPGKSWFKSRLSAGGNCVELTVGDNDQILMRNSRDPEGAVLEFTPSEIKAFLGRGIDVPPIAVRSTGMPQGLV
jgi:hypothetical protein